jgi:cation transport regulator ChaB
MPYATTKDLPPGTRGLPEHAKEVFRGAFNAAHKKNSGDEASAFRIAWSAAKKARKKKQQDGNEEGTRMEQLLKHLRGLVQSVRAASPDLDPAKLQEAETLLAAAPADDAAFQALTRTLEQSFGYYLSKPSANFEGSLEERIEVLCKELREQGIVGRYGYAVSVFPDYLIAGDPGDDYMCCCDDGDGPTYWKIPFTISEDNKTVTFGDRVEVELQMVAIEVGVAGETEQAKIDPASLFQEIAAKTEATDQKPDSKEDRPEWLIQGQDPPGGPKTLLQQQSYILQTVGTDEATGVMSVRGVATTGDVVNAMKQVYPWQVWQDNEPRLQRLLTQGKLVGEAMHPADGRVSLDRTCMKFTKIWLDQDDKQIKFEADLIPTEPHGKNLQLLIQNGVSVDISSRGAGEFAPGQWHGAPAMIVQRGFRCDGFDSVISGASPGSTITDWSLQSTSSEDSEEEEMSKELLEELAASMKRMAAKQDDQDKVLLRLTQAKDADVTKIEAVKDPAVETAPVVTQATETPKVDPEIERMKRINDMSELALVRGRIESMVQEAKQAGTFGGAWINTYHKHLRQCEAKTLEELETANTRIVSLLSDMVQDAPKFPARGFTVQKDVGERGFKTGIELIDHLVSDLPDDMPNDPHGLFQQADPENPHETMIPQAFRTPRRHVKQVMLNMARYQDDVFNGPAALQSLVRLSQGYGPNVVAENVLYQTCADGTTAVGSGGAPSSALFIFPLVRQVYPRLIATELASVQPMDRPDGKIFYLDAVRKDANGYTDASGATISNRMPIQRSDSFSDSYANDPGECESTLFVQLKLSSKTVTAATKKLSAAWSIEEMQDLRAYHNLDVSLELVGGLSREVALEWNQIVLNEMLTGATAGNLTFNTTAPSGYTQKEWDEYLPRYLDAASNLIFKKRNGDMTHIVAGPDAWLKLSATHRIATNPNSETPSQFEGLTLTPFMGGSTPGLKVYKTSFWAGRNTDKILVLRRGQDWSDTGYVWAPYIDYVSPVLTLPDTFNQKQGILSRVAHKTVVGDAFASISIASGTGVPL